MSEKKSPSVFKNLARASQMGIHLVVSTFVGFYIGKGLDYLFHTSAVFTVVFLLLGIAAGFLEIYRTAMKMMDKDD